MAATFIITDIEIISLRTHMDQCKTKCDSKQGHLPYFFEGMSCQRQFFSEFHKKSGRPRPLFKLMLLRLVSN